MDLDLTDIQDRLSHYHPGPMGQQRHYAVLLPLIEVDGDLHILYEIRASHISHLSQEGKWKQVKAFKQLL